MVEADDCVVLPHLIIPWTAVGVSSPIFQWEMGVSLTVVGSHLQLRGCRFVPDVAEMQIRIPTTPEEDK